MIENDIQLGRLRGSVSRTLKEILMQLRVAASPMIPLCGGRIHRGDRAYAHEVLDYFSRHASELVPAHVA